MNKKRQGGFTLVELIVVIAILGILAGVGTVAYTGYVEKAEEAADQQLLSAVNLAFASACIDSGTDINAISGGSIGVDSDGKVGTASATDVSDTNFNTNFQAYLGDENTTFKKITKLAFDALYHRFVDGMGDVHYAYGGTYVKVSGKTAEALKGSAFITADGLGANGILDRVDYVASFATLFLSDDNANASQAFADIMGGDDYKRSLAAYLGVTDADTLSGDALDAAIEAAMPSGLQTEDGARKVLTNGAVLYAAQNAVNQDADELLQTLKKSNAKDIIKNANGGDLLAQAALTYGMYTAYAYSTMEKEAAETATNDVTSVFNALNDEGFKAYLETPQAKTDLNAYMSALSTINNTAQDSTAAKNVLEKGFADDDLKGILSAALGQ